MNLESLVNLAKLWFEAHLLNILIIVGVAYLAKHVGTQVLYRLVKNTVRQDIYPTERDRKKRVQTLDALVKTVINLTVWVIAGLMIISELGVNTGPLVASAGILGIALGFGAQSLVKDFVSGVFIIAENQYRIGDVVELGAITGTVEAITIRTTILRDQNGYVHHVPNGSITVTTNKTMDIGRINETLIVGKETDLEQLEHVINHVGEEISNSSQFSKTIKEQPHFGGLNGFEKGGVIIKIYGETIPGEQWKIRAELYRQLLKACKKNGIEVPYSQPALSDIPKDKKRK